MSKKAFAICLLTLLSGDAAVKSQDELDSLNGRFGLLRDAGNLKEAAQIGERLVEVARVAKSRRPQDAAGTLHNVASVYEDLARYDEADKLLGESRELYESVHGREHLDVAMTMNTLGVVKLRQAAYVKAEKLFQAALAMQERLVGKQSTDAAYSLNNLGLLYATQGDFRKAEPYYEQALQIKRSVLGPQNADVATGLNNLSSVYEATGRLREAEALQRQALALRVKLLKNDHPQILQSYGNLGIVLVKQGNLQEAEPLLKQALLLRQEAGLGNHPQAAFDLSYLGALYRSQARYSDAERAYRRALRIREENLPADHLLVLESRIDLASLLHQAGLLRESAELHAKLLANKTLPPDRRLKLLYNAGQLAEQQKDIPTAAAAYKEALALIDQHFDQSHPERAKIIAGFARLARQEGKGQEALEGLNAAIEISDRSAQSPREAFLLYQERAKLLYDLGKPQDAIRDLTRALELAERQRSLAAGVETDRAHAFAEFAGAFDLLIAWHSTAGQVNEAIVTADQLRARSLADQLQAQLHGADLLAGLPREQADELRRRLDSQQLQLASVERQLENLNQQQEFTTADRLRRSDLEGELNKARNALAETHGEIRNVSPAFRRGAGNRRQQFSTQELQAWIDRERVLVLAYHFGHEGGHLAILAPETAPRLLPLLIDAAQAEKLKTTPGLLNLDRLQKLMQVGIHSLPYLISREEITAEVQERLALLGDLLVPAEAKDARAARYRWCCVVPSGPLNLVPLECLITERGSPPRYVLDACPPMAYAPSLQILQQLAQREAPAGPVAEAPVLTVGNPAYGAVDPSSAPFARAGGKLPALPYSGWESTWVADVFGKSGSQSVRLTERSATEANVRQQVAGRRIVHLACHGLADDAHGNLFGALVLAPGTGKLVADDGNLTLSEIYQLDARQCELAILSACRTNYGPEQRGEGTWTLSRGFLVAGSRRVVASTWLVDDEAAASLISFYGSLLAKKEMDGMAGYAQHLQAAKRWVRQQEKWKSPFYWGTFVLVGPN